MRTTGQAPIVVCAELKPLVFDAHNMFAGAARVLADNAVPGLLTVGDDIAPAGSLATSWGWENPTTAWFEIAEGHRFVTGRELDAEAVRENLLRIRRAKGAIFNPTEYEAIASVEAVGRRVIVRLDRPFAPLFGVLANGVGMVDMTSGEPPQNLTGAGPFRITGSSFEALTLEKIAGAQRKIEWRYCTSKAARIRRVRNDAADVLIGGSGGEIAAERGWTQMSTPAPGPTHVVFNMRRTPTSSLGFRRAVAEALDPAEILAEGIGGQGRIARAPFPMDSAFPVGDAPGPRESAPLPQRPDELVLGIGGDELLPTARAVARAIRHRLGIRVRITIVLVTDWWPRQYLAGDWDLALLPTNPLPDPHLVYARRYATNGVHNGCGYSNHDFDRLVTAAAATVNALERLQLYREAEAIRAADLPSHYLYFPDRVAWIRPGVTGLELRRSRAVDLSRLQLETDAQTLSSLSNNPPLAKIARA